MFQSMIFLKMRSLFVALLACAVSLLLVASLIGFIPLFQWITKLQGDLMGVSSVKLTILVGLAPFLLVIGWLWCHTDVNGKRFYPSFLIAIYPPLLAILAYFGTCLFLTVQDPKPPRELMTLKEAIAGAGYIPRPVNIAPDKETVLNIKRSLDFPGGGRRSNRNETVERIAAVRPEATPDESSLVLIDYWGSGHGADLITPTMGEDLPPIKGTIIKKTTPVEMWARIGPGCPLRCIVIHPAWSVSDLAIRPLILAFVIAALLGVYFFAYEYRKHQEARQAASREDYSTQVKQIPVMYRRSI